MKKSKARSPVLETETKALTVWQAAGVEVVSLQNGRPTARCRFGGLAPAFFGGDEAATRVMLEAAIEAVKNGALGEIPADRSIRLP